MGCGCKNKPNNQAQPQQGPQVAQQQKMENARKINEDVKSGTNKSRAGAGRPVRAGEASICPAACPRPIKKCFRHPPRMGCGRQKIVF